jgi:hypothetical protein
MCGFVTLPVWADLTPENIELLQKESQEKVDCYKMHLLTCLKNDMESRRALLEKISSFVVLMDIMRADNLQEIIQAPYFRYCILSNNSRHLDSIPYPFGQMSRDTATFITTSSTYMQGVMKNSVMPRIRPLEIDLQNPEIVRHRDEYNLQEMIAPLRMMYLVAKFNPNPLPLPVFTDEAANKLEYCPTDIAIQNGDGSLNLGYFKQWDQNIKNELFWITRETHIFDTLSKLSSGGKNILCTILRRMEKVRSEDPMLADNSNVQDAFHFLQQRIDRVRVPQE